ncbi:MAG: hypothetical protein HYY13_04275 [Nitrospirae bacterium]|nr:hypothetical protein [Nitrospirota bacterium]
MTTDGKDESGRPDACRPPLWAKTAQDGDHLTYHRLLCHMLDVAAVTFANEAGFDGPVRREDPGGHAGLTHAGYPRKAGGP